ncbi:hypothetical protein R6Q57_003819 [Mikania cordata]
MKDRSLDYSIEEFGLLDSSIHNLIASLAIRTGSGFLLKGVKEARRSNAILHELLVTIFCFPELKIEIILPKF